MLKSLGFRRSFQCVEKLIDNWRFKGVTEEGNKKRERAKK